MKKNVMMRIASFLLVAVLISTSAISGTYAKYVTADEGTDEARVAKFGVVVTAEGSLFDKNYKDAPETDAAAMTVVSSDATKNVVAPGTKNGDKPLKFSITGTPEVDVKITVEVTDSKADIFLKNKTGLPDLTTGKTDTFDLAADYYPVKYTLTHGSTVKSNLNLDALKTELANLSVTKVDAGKDLATEFGSFEITWEWAYGNEDSDAGNDKADTLLGGLAAGDITGLTKGTDYNLETGLTIKVTVTQIN